jgi:hypothetical protein
LGYLQDPGQCVYHIRQLADLDHHGIGAKLNCPT